MSFIRVVRFTDVTADSVETVVKLIAEADGPPPGVTSTGITLAFDEAQGTAVVLQAFATAEDMAAAEALFDAMPPGETPGTRATIDRAEIAIERSM